MPKRLRLIGHDERLSIVDHLDELRSRLIVCVSVLVVVFGLCFAESSHLLSLLNAPLEHLSQDSPNHISGITGDQVGEPFTTTITVCLYFSLLICLPLLLYEVLAFVMPGLTPREKSVVLPVIWVAPVLFFAGVVFTYIIVLPAAISFLQGYNSSQFQALVQAQPLYSFEVLTMGAIGLAFEMPLVLLGLRAVGVIDGNTLTRHWRYAIVIIAVIAAAMPGADPVTTGLETAPLVILFLASIVLLKAADRRAVRRAAAQELAPASTG
jgi:sec-independent protein translocase protein TatC